VIRRALILDTETTGVASTDSVIELGLVLYSVEHQTTLIQFSALRRCTTGNPAAHINRISPAALADFDLALDCDSIALDLLAPADVVVAHNAAFDRQFFDGPWHEKDWLCTQTDFRWPAQTRANESLVSLALAHGIGVASAHRALTDCQLIASLFDRMTDLQAMFATAMRPKKLYRAIVEYPQRQLAKDAGFQWNAPGYEKMWTRRLTPEEAAAMPFYVAPIAEVASVR